MKMTKTIYATKFAEVGSADYDLALSRGWEPFTASMLPMPKPSALAGRPELALRFFVGLRKSYNPDVGGPDADVDDYVDDVKTTDVDDTTSKDG